MIFADFIAVHVKQVWGLIGLPRGNYRAKVAVFGAGAHSVWLQSVVANVKGPDVIAVLDDAPETKPSLWGHKPIKPETWIPSPTDIIVVSSDTAGYQIKQRCLDLYGPDICVLNLYDGFPPGPYPKNAVAEEQELSSANTTPSKEAFAVLTKKLDQINGSLWKLNNLSRHQIAELYGTYVGIHNQNKTRNRPRFLCLSRDMWDFHGIHSGHRCFIIGNGPSLNEIDMSLLRNEITFGSNRIYLGFPKWGFTCTYWGIQDETQVLQAANKYLVDLPQEITKFIPLQFIEHLDHHRLQNVVPFNFIAEPSPYPQFSTSPSAIFNGWTVTFSLLQMAVLMGCNPIYLIGIDHRYQIGATEIKGTNRWTDPMSKSHFHPDYCDTKNCRLWNLPDIPRMEAAYGMAKNKASQIGISIFNATPNSALTCFPHINYCEIFLPN